MVLLKWELCCGHTLHECTLEVTRHPVSTLLIGRAIQFVVFPVLKKFSCMYHRGLRIAFSPWPWTGSAIELCHVRLHWIPAADVTRHADCGSRIPSRVVTEQRNIIAVQWKWEKQGIDTELTTSIVTLGVTFCPNLLVGPNRPHCHYSQQNFRLRCTQPLPL